MSLTDTTPPPPAATAGIDWASDNHAVCVLDGDGRVVDRQTVAHTAAGLRRLTDLLARYRVSAVGIERGAGPVIDALLGTDVQAITAQIRALAKQISHAYDTHPDKPIVAKLPKAGTVRAARLLAEIGDARGRFPTANALACLAGVAPSTRESGKARIVAFRWAVDKQLRDAICDLAGDSRHANAWAAQLYNRARGRGHDHPHAVRILARAWIDIIWKCWTTNTPYDPANHRALQNILKPDEPGDQPPAA